jgi:endonuclease/exonuclease/phosphatase family metal-dependent hydrolase
MMRVWITLGALLFLARCGDQIKPYYRQVFGDKQAERLPAPAPVNPGRIRIASWNLEWLSTPGRGTEARSHEDLRRLSLYAERLNADVIAVQEIGSAEALGYVFGTERYAFHLTQRGGAQKTGFVVRRSLDAKLMPDVNELAQQRLRAGADLNLTLGARSLRLLSIHLKAFCVKGSLSDPDHDCQQLREQIPVLRKWMDERKRERVAFGVLGDFNRPLDDADDAWRELSESEPAHALLRTDKGRMSLCQSRQRGRPFIDHLLLGGGAADWVLPDTFRELRYDETDKASRDKLSDHCPILVELQAAAR